MVDKCIICDIFYLPIFVRNSSSLEIWLLIVNRIHQSVAISFYYFSVQQQQKKKIWHSLPLCLKDVCLNWEEEHFQQKKKMVFLSVWTTQIVCLLCLQNFKKMFQLHFTVCFFFFATAIFLNGCQAIFFSVSVWFKYAFNLCFQPLHFPLFIHCRFTVTWYLKTFMKLEGEK